MSEYCQACYPLPSSKCSFSLACFPAAAGISPILLYALCLISMHLSFTCERVLFFLFVVSPPLLIYHLFLFKVKTGGKHPLAILGVVFCSGAVDLLRNIRVSSWNSDAFIKSRCLQPPGPFPYSKHMCSLLRARVTGCRKWRR